MIDPQYLGEDGNPPLIDDAANHVDSFPFGFAPSGDEENVLPTIMTLMGEAKTPLYQEQYLPTEESTPLNSNYQMPSPYQSTSPLAISNPLQLSYSSHLLSSSSSFSSTTASSTSSPPTANRTPIDLQKEFEREALVLKQLQNRLADQLQRLQAEEVILKKYVEHLTGDSTFALSNAYSIENGVAEGDGGMMEEEIVEEEEDEDEDKQTGELEIADNTEENGLSPRRQSKRKRKQLYEYGVKEVKNGDEDEDDEDDEDDADDIDEKYTNDLKSILMSKLGRNYRNEFSSANTDEDDGDEDDVD